jgi:hypothetical protein
MDTGGLSQLRMKCNKEAVGLHSKRIIYAISVNVESVSLDANATSINAAAVSVN